MFCLFFDINIVLFVNVYGVIEFGVNYIDWYFCRFVFVLFFEYIVDVVGKYVSIYEVIVGCVE